MEQILLELEQSIGKEIAAMARLRQQIETFCATASVNADRRQAEVESMLAQSRQLQRLAGQRQQHQQRLAPPEHRGMLLPLAQVAATLAVGWQSRLLLALDQHREERVRLQAAIGKAQKLMTAGLRVNEALLKILWPDSGFYNPQGSVKRNKAGATLNRKV